MTVPKEDFPVFKCFPWGDCALFLRFWCPFCKKWHYHGIGTGHRVSHCTNGLLRESGYIIKPYTKAELIEIRKKIDSALKYGAHGRTYDKKVKEWYEKQKLRQEKRS